MSSHRIKIHQSTLQRSVAADIEIPGIANAELAQYIANDNFDQLNTRML